MAAEQCQGVTARGLRQRTSPKGCCTNEVRAAPGQPSMYLSLPQDRWACVTIRPALLQLQSPSAHKLQNINSHQCINHGWTNYCQAACACMHAAC
jgi:hypothetical protein